jgi:hypothetical protein
MTLEKLGKYKEAYDSYNKAIEIKLDAQVAKKRMDDLVRVLKLSKSNK